MPDVVQTRDGATVLMCAPDGLPIGDEQSAVDLMPRCGGQHVQRLVPPVVRLAEDFFVLRTKVAGAVVQKLQQYGFRVAVVGDIAGYVEQSTALRDFVYESNRGRQLWFVADEAKLDARLSAAGDNRSNTLCTTSLHPCVNSAKPSKPTHFRHGSTTPPILDRTSKVRARTHGISTCLCFHEYPLMPRGASSLGKPDDGAPISR